MLYMNGQYASAKIFTNKCEMSAQSQIMELLNTPIVKDSQIRIMPDVHAGKGCVIGFTMTVKDKIIPNLVGVDIGCGMSVYKLGQIEIDYDKLDSVIRERIPAGRAVRDKAHSSASDFNFEGLYCFDNIDLDRAKRSLGTLGGGNHFIEIDVDDENNKYLIIHSGSRHLGTEVCKYYQDLAEKHYQDSNVDFKQSIIEAFKAIGREQEIEEALKNMAAAKRNNYIPKDLRYIEGDAFSRYMYDMDLITEYAHLNRRIIANTIMAAMDWCWTRSFETIHNYIDIDDMIVRKGAVSAEKGEELIIPMNMRDGSLLCVGLGNKDWNCSAPHGAGRLMSRKEAKESIMMDEFQESMKDVYSTSVTAATIDESPMAYKPMNDILDCIGETVEVQKIIKPLYNFKAGE